MEDKRNTIKTPDDIFPYFSDDPVFISAAILEEPPLCMVMNKGLSDMSLYKAVSEYYVYLADYNDEQRYVVAGGFYRKKQSAFDKLDPKLIAQCNTAKKWVNSGARDTSVLDELIEDPLCILISTDLEDKRFDILQDAWEIIRVEHEGQVRDAIACVYLDPDYDPGPGRVLGQFMQESTPQLAEG